jgi:hypothetical protein
MGCVSCAHSQSSYMLVSIMLSLNTNSKVSPIAFLNGIFHIPNHDAAGQVTRHPFFQDECGG